MPKLIVAGIDPSLSNLGMAKAEIDTGTNQIELLDLKLVRTEPSSVKTVRKSSDDLLRCRTLYEAFQEFTAGVSCVFAEVPVGSQSASSMKMVGLATMLMASSRVPIIEVSPTEIKKAVGGKKTTTKNEIIGWAYDLWPCSFWITHANAKRAGNLTDANEHLADACGAIYTGMRLPMFRQIINIVSTTAS